MEVVVGLKKKDKKQLPSIEMKFFRRIARYTLFDRKRRNFDEKLRRFKSNWLRHVTSTNSSRTVEIVLNCRPNGRR